MQNLVNAARNPRFSRGISLRVLLLQSRIQRRVREMGRDIRRDFGAEPIHLIGVLEGAAPLLADLLDAVGAPVTADFIGAASYGRGRKSSGRVELTRDLSADIAGRNCLLAEDILDTGLTLHFLREMLLRRKPKALRIVVLLSKRVRRVQRVRAHYVGFHVAPEFLVGYGLDYAGRYRDLPDIYALELARTRSKNARAL